MAKSIFIISIILFLYLFISIHELGHDLMGRIFGLTVTNFGIGFGHGVPIKHIKLGIPFTGYVVFADDKLFTLPPIQQMAIAAAGPCVNIIIGLILVPLSKLFALVSLFAALNFIPINLRNPTDGWYFFNAFKKWRDNSV